MSIIEMKAIYTALEESGDLKKMFPGLTGDWEKDEKTFTTEYNTNERILENLEVEDVEDDFENYF